MSNFWVRAFQISHLPTFAVLPEALEEAGKDGWLLCSVLGEGKTWTAQLVRDESAPKQHFIYEVDVIISSAYIPDDVLGKRYAKGWRLAAAASGGVVTYAFWVK